MSFAFRHWRSIKNDNGQSPIGNSSELRALPPKKPIFGRPRSGPSSKWLILEFRWAKQGRAALAVEMSDVALMDSNLAQRLWKKGDTIQNTILLSLMVCKMVVVALMFFGKMALVYGAIASGVAGSDVACGTQYHGTPSWGHHCQ